jgi:hypothetical protein
MRRLIAALGGTAPEDAERLVATMMGLLARLYHCETEPTA